MVRISKHKGVFDKGYMPNWSKEHFTVADAPAPRRGTKRRVYKIADNNGEPVKGVWYPEELQKISNNQYRIERYSGVAKQLTELLNFCKVGRLA